MRTSFSHTLVSSYQNCKMEIDMELLITLVEARPVLWDKTCTEYKDKNETKKAWREVCVILKNDFEEIDDNEKNAFGKQVIKRWGNVRDAFKKSCKKEKVAKKSGAGASNIKKYIFNDQLQFLNKVFEQRETFDSLSQEIENSESTGDQSANKKEDSENFKKPTKQLGSRKRKNLDEIELKMLKVLEEPSDRHLSFFKGIIPTLNSFTDDEVVQFQLEVMQIITKIKKQKHSVHHHQSMYQHQPVFQNLRPQSQPIYQSSFPQSQPIYQILHPQSHLASQNQACEDNASQQILRTTQLSSTTPLSIQSLPPATATSASQYYCVYGEELATTPSPLSTNSSIDDSIDFADTNFV